MRYLTFICLILFFGCKSKNIHDNKFKGFHYSLDNLMIPKVFVYSREDSSNIKSFQYEHVYIEGKDSFLIKSSMNSGNIRDSNKFLISGQKIMLIETYLTQKYPKRTDFKIAKGEIIKCTDEMTGESKIKYTDPTGSFITEIETNVKFDTLMSLNYKNKFYPCIICSNKIKVRIKHRYLFFISKKIEKYQMSIFAKDLGLIHYTVTDAVKGDNYNWRLDTIMDYKK
jgi:hypothetical protein